LTAVNTKKMQPEATETVLVVDDSRAQRRILSSYLARWGYKVFEAASGQDALDLCEAEHIDIIVSDWMMPGINGLDFCRIFRTLERESYGYFILLTSKSDKAEVAQGLDVGADDFLTKPVAGDEILARIRAGGRIVRMQRELTEKNRLVSSTLHEISSLYDALDRDLEEARKLQLSLVREKFRNFGSAQVSLLLRPSGPVGGDLVGFFAINDDQIGIFSIDVSGHGIASALMTARIAAYLTGSNPNQNIAICEDDTGRRVPKKPSDVAHELNRLVLEELDTDLYFTMILGHFNKRTGEFVMTQCGHPHPAILHSDHSMEYFGGSGMPVGLFSDAAFENHTKHISQGDRILLMSDGIIECPREDGVFLGEDGLQDIILRAEVQTGYSFFDTMMHHLNDLKGHRDFPDDISGVFLEYTG
jgi:sigma-B regulation protein RsbU (phosphoserine phosphatase)